MPRINLKNVFYSYLDKKGHVVNDVFQAEFKDKEISIILGESGSGKTTLLNIISGLDTRYEGSISFDDTDIKNLTFRDKDISYIKQNYVLYPTMTVFENIAFPLKFTLLKQDEINQRVRDIAKKLGIEHCLARKPKYLSKGQQQRVNLAKAFIKEPTLLLFDEPFSNLDPTLKEELTTLVKDFIKELNATAVWVTHSYLEALRMGDNIYLLEKGVISPPLTGKQMQDSLNPYLVALRNESKIKEEDLNG